VYLKMQTFIIKGFYVAACVLLVANVIDLVATLCWTMSGFEEANPLMASALHEGPVAFAIAKLGLVCLGVYYITNNVKWISIIGMYVATALYTYVCLLHLYKFLTL